MKHKLEDFFYFLTLWFSISVIVLAFIGLAFRAVAHLSK